MKPNILIFFGMMTIFLSCRNDDDSKYITDNAALVGTWYAQSMTYVETQVTVDFSNVPLDSRTYVTFYDNDDIQLEFKEVVNQGGYIGTYDYFPNQSRIHINFPLNGFATIEPLTNVQLSGEELIFQYNDIEEGVRVYTFIRE